MSEVLAGGFARPRWAHVPGRTEAPDSMPLDAAKATLPLRFGGPPPADHPALRYGLALCDLGFFWEAHEVLEPVWLATPPNSRDRHALRAAIQIANAGLKLRMGRRRAALRLLAEVRHLLLEVGPGRGASFADRLDAVGLCAEVDRLAASLETGAVGIVIPSLAARVADMHQISH